MAKGLKKPAQTSDTHLGQLQLSLIQKVKASRKAEQELELSQHDFCQALELCFAALDTNSDEQSDRLTNASEALEVLALLLPLAPRPKDQHVPTERRLAIVEICWSLWAATSALQHKCQAALEATLRLSDKEQLATDPTFLRLVDLLQSHRLASKRSLTCFAFLLPFAPAVVTQRFPNLLQDLLATLNQPELSSHAGKVAFQALQVVPAAVPPASKQKRSQIIATIGCCLLDMDAQSRTALCLYVLGPLFAQDKAWYRLLADWLETAKANKASQVMPAELALTETAYRAGILPRQTISDELLNEALASNQSHLRMSALAIVARPPSARQSPLTDSDFNLLTKHFLHHLSKTADAEERNAITGHWKIVLDRLRASTYAAQRDIRVLSEEPSPSDASDRSIAHQKHLQATKTFLATAYANFINSLHPLAPYRSQSSALRYLSILLASGVVECWRDPSTPTPSKAPQVSWPFSLDQYIDVQHTLRQLTKGLTSTYEDIQTTSYTLIQGFPRDTQPTCLVSSSDFEARIDNLLSNGRKSQAQTAALLLQLEEAGDASSGLRKALHRARKEVDQVVENISLAAESCPMHGAIQCLTASIKAESLTLQLKDELLSLVDAVYIATSPIMTNTAPEGTEVADHEEARAFEMGQEDPQDEFLQESSSGSQGSVKHKVIMSACWRAMRQAGIVLERLVSLVSSDPAAFRMLWPLQDIEKVAERYHHYLLNIRHRGCFTALADSYEAFLTTLSRVSSWPELQELPEKWLKKRLSASVDDTLSFTRRSAGLPYLILATLVASRSKRSQLLQLSMDHLFQVAQDNTTESNNNVQVHSINTLRSIFLESKLGPAVLPYAERGFLLSIHSFRSEFWPTRNAALLLYSALIQRVFSSSSKKSTSESSAWAGRPSRNDFFKEYPIENALLQELDHCLQKTGVDATEGDKQSSLFAVLLLLSKLATPTRLPGQTFANDPLLLRVQKCLGSRVWKIREVAADATSGLLTPEELPEYLDSLLASSDTQGENLLHGHLLSLLRISECHTLPASARAQVLSKLDSVASRCLSRTFASSQAFCKLCSTSLGAPLGSHDLPNVSARLREKFISHAALQSKHGTFTLLPDGAALFLQLEAEDVDVFQLFLSSDAPAAVQHIALDHCATRASVRNDNDIKRLIQALVISRDTDLHVRLHALELIDVETQFLSEDSLGGLLDKCAQTARGPLRESLMPLIASQIQVASAAQTQRFGTLVLESSLEDESETTRWAAAKSLIPLQGGEVDKELHMAMLQLLQDDDVEVRAIAAERAVGYTNTSVVHHQGVAVGDVWSKFSRLLSRQDIIEHILLPRLKLDSLRADENVLFIDERPNLFIDDSVLINLAEEALRTKGSASQLTAELKNTVAAQVQRFDEAVHNKFAEDKAGEGAFEEYLDDPLGLSSLPSWYGAALRLKVMCEAAGVASPKSIALLLK